MVRRKNVIELLEPRTLFTTAFTVQFNDPANIYLPYHDEVQSTLMAAASEWATKISGTGTIDLEVDFDPSVPTAQTASTVSVPVAMTAGGIEIDEQGVTHEIRTGVDPNGTAPDATITIGTRYLANDLWFDPDPLLRNTSNADSIPNDKVDAYSVFLHELEHAFAFNGNRDGITGVLPASADNVESTFDQYIAADNSGNLFFTGPHAKAVYGGNVPLTFANAFHVGNRAPKPGSDIAGDLMNGVGFLRGYRYNISDLDIAMLTDSGVPIVGTAPTLSVSSATHAEGDFGTSSLVFDVSLNTVATMPVSVTYTTQSGSAIAGADFSQESGTLIIPAGQTFASISIPVIGNTTVQSDKTFTLALSNPSGVTLATNAVTGTITNDDFVATRTLTFTSKMSASYLDSAGKSVVVSLKGPGSGTISFDSTSTSADAKIISIAGTTARSALTIKARSTTLPKLVATSTIGSIDAHSVHLTSSLSAPVTGSLSLGQVSHATITLTAASPMVFSAQSISDSGITGTNFRSFSAGVISDLTLGALAGIDTFTAMSLSSSTIFAGTATPPITLPTVGTAFTRRSASIKTLTVKGVFSDTVITAPTLGTVKIGRVSVSNNHHAFGLAAHSFTSVAATTPAMPHLKLSKLKNAAKDFNEGDFAVSVI